MTTLLFVLLIAVALYLTWPPLAAGQLARAKDRLAAIWRKLGSFGK